ncbi:putative tail tubular protein B [uncultured Mediterranean phage]|nr:putative tail tubular protein B [uncultured Mediterranean phage]
MANINYYQPQFNAGELSEFMLGRTDFKKYESGLAEMLNAIPLPEGGAMRRSGSRFVAEVKDSSAKTRLKKFEFSTKQAYVLEMGNKYIRWFRNQGQIVTADTTVQVQNGEFTDDISAWSDTSGSSSSISHNATDKRLTLSGTSASDNAVAEQQVTVPTDDNIKLHHLRFRVVGNPNDNMTLRIGTATDLADIVDNVEFKPGYHVHSFVTNGADFFLQFRVHENQTVDIDGVSIIQGAALEIGAPWATADLFEIEGPQSADVLYFFHGDYRTHKLMRLSDVDWSLIEVNWLNGPWQDANTDTAKTLKPSATTGIDITLVASGFSPFDAKSIGQLVRINNKSSGVDYGYGRIVSVESDQNATIDIIRAFQQTTAASDYAFGSWSDIRGWPQNGAFFEQRLVTAATATEPQTSWYSQTADFENHLPDDNAGTVADADALNFTISADDVNAIQWISPGLDLVYGTSGGEWIPSSNGAVITPTDIDIKRHTKHGSAKVQPVRFGHVVLFLQKAKRKIREFAFHFEVDGNRAFDMTRLSRDITRSGVNEMDFAQEPWSLLWAVRDDGVMPALTWLRDEDVVGWSRHILGGSFGTGDTVVESVSVIPGNTSTKSNDRDEVWVIAKRTIDSGTKRYVEFLERDFETGDTQADAFYVDSGLSYSGSATTSITGLAHLVGETVAIWGDGAIQPSVVVNPEGEIKLQNAVSTAVIGLKYKHRIKTLKLEGGSHIGTVVGKSKRIIATTLELLNAHSAFIGPDDDNLIEFDFREVSDSMDTGAPLFKGGTFRELEGDFEPDPRTIIESEAPAPFTILSLAPEVELQDEA